MDPPSFLELTGAKAVHVSEQLDHVLDVPALTVRMMAEKARPAVPPRLENDRIGRSAFRAVLIGPRTPNGMGVVV
jgi:hypothetical protein